MLARKRDQFTRFRDAHRGMLIIARVGSASQTDHAPKAGSANVESPEAVNPALSQSFRVASVNTCTLKH